ncbi:MAG: DUF1638 domain-containing protein, partial [Dehalococcoidia bacterium]|nr:DUF1638 domain-containing protein [Dehalococcoidia bacterium]
VAIMPLTTFGGTVSTLLLACGSLRRELREIQRRHGWPVEVEYLPPELHLSPAKLAETISRRLEAVRGRYQRVLAVYGRCAPGLDEALECYGAERLPGEHCYEMLGDGQFMPLLREEPGTYFLTDFLCRNFRSVMRGLGLDRYPRLRQVYFRNYTRVVYLDTGTHGRLEGKAGEIASYLGLPLLTVKVGVSGLERRLAQALGAGPLDAAQERLAL